MCCYLFILASALSELQWLEQSFREHPILSLHLQELLPIVCLCSKLLSFNLDLPLDANGAVGHKFFFSFQHLFPFYTVLSRHFTRASTSCSSVISKRGLVMVLLPMLTFPSCSSRASDIILARKIFKRVVERSLQLLF